MQRIAVEEYLATIIDEVRGTRYLTVAHQVALSVVTSAIGILPTLQIAVSQDNSVCLRIECQSLTFVNASIADGQIVQRHVAGSHVDAGIGVHTATALRV